jgi:hypothetical protein
VVIDLEPNSKPRRNEKTVWREEEEEIYICSEDGQTLYTLAEVGADIWRACDGEHTFAEITELLMAAYEVDEETLTGDMKAFFSEMKSNGLIFF